MPDKIDWILLKKTISEYHGEIVDIWGHITPENAQLVAKEKYHEKDLFEFLLFNEHYSDANTIASSMSLFDEKYIQLVYEIHHLIYQELLKILCTDRMILTFEEYYDGIYPKTENNKEDETKLNDFYRSKIAKRYQKILLNDNSDKYSTDIIIDLLDEFRFMTHIYLNNFYQFVIPITVDSLIVSFTTLYKKYLDLVPLIYRLVNEYYLEYVKYLVKTIHDIIDSSFIIVSERYEDLSKCLVELPIDYVDLRYTDSTGNNLLAYLATVPLLSKEINLELYQNFFQKEIIIPLHLQNTDGNTIFHLIAENNNHTMLEALLQWIKTNDFLVEEIGTKSKIKINELVNIKNNANNTFFHILLNSKNFSMIMQMLEYLPITFYHKLTQTIIDNFEILDEMPKIGKIQQIYLDCLNCLFNQLSEIKINIIYDLKHCSDTRTKIFKLLDKCQNEIDSDQSFYLDWLLICINTNEIDLFKSILSKFLSDKPVPNPLNSKLQEQSEETLIITAIKQQKIPFVQCLLNFAIDLDIKDGGNKNAIINALETKNLYLLYLIRKYIEEHKSHQEMTSVINYFIELMERTEVFDILSIPETIRKLWNLLECGLNYLFYGIKS